MKTAAMIAASISAVFFVLGTGVWCCVLKGDGRRKWYCICCLLWGVTASVSWGQEPIANHTYWTAASAAIGATTADAITTSLMVGQGRGCPLEVSSPFLYGTQPNPARTAGVMAAELGLSAFASYEARKHLHGKLRQLWSAPLLYVATVHACGTINNLEHCRLIALRNDVQSMDGDTGELLDIAQKHFAQIQEYWESKNIWKRFVRGASQ